MVNSSVEAGMPHQNTARAHLVDRLLHLVDRLRMVDAITMQGSNHAKIIGMP